MVDPVVPASSAAEERSPDVARLICLACAATLAGALAGLVGGAFRLALDWADTLRASFLGWSRQWPGLGWLWPVAAVALCAAAARALVRLAPVASGSGVQHVEAVMRGELEPAPLRVLPVKFIGGTLAMGSGLALGREGPTVQMGSTLGVAIARLLRLQTTDMRTLQAAAAGAGLAVAFNAPIGGALFVLEEVVKGFELRAVHATLIASAVAIGVARLMIGDRPMFVVATLAPPPFLSLLPHLLAGMAFGLLGAAYSRITVWGLDAFDRFPGLPAEARAAIVGAAVGLLAWFAPSLAGSGDALNQQVLDGTLSVTALGIIFVVRWLLGPWCYAAGTPGGLFAPLLVVGAAFGALCGDLVHTLAPALAPQPLAFAVVGMAAFFTAVVRAPLTGIVLVVEMTATTALLAPMLTACFAAALVATLAGSEPIYDTLRRRSIARAGDCARG
ncbi:MAG: H(+)/Cl(-) exchange transporter ClcA [Betaproteobacteria bacterium]|nr:H(+)/Cl(-) exchange transporter ClcA [Betaproteobacteria bacterium]